MNKHFYDEPTIIIISKIYGKYGFLADRRIIQAILDLLKIRSVLLPQGAETIIQTDFDNEIINAHAQIVLIDDRFSITDRVKDEGSWAMKHEVPLIILIRSPNGNISNEIEDTIKTQFGSLVYENDIIVYRNSQDLISKLIIRLIRFFQGKRIMLLSYPKLRIYNHEYSYKFNADILHTARNWTVSVHRTSLFLNGARFWSYYEGPTIDEAERYLSKKPNHSKFIHVFDLIETQRDMHLNPYKYEKGGANKMKEFINKYAEKPGVGFIGVSKALTIPSCGADGNLMLILTSDTNKYTCTFENVPYEWVVDNLLPLPTPPRVKLIKTSVEIDELYNNSPTSKIA